MRKLKIFVYLGFSVLLLAPVASISGSPNGLATLQEFPLPKADLNFIFDGANKVLYGGDQSSRTIYRIDLQSGATKSLSFTNTPQRLALSPDGSHLYVALWLHLPNSSTAENQSGTLSEIDCLSLIETRQLPLQIDPFDLVLLAPDKVVISSISGDLTYIDTYDLKTGDRLGSASHLIYPACWLVPHPTGRVYALGGYFLHRLDLDPASGAYLQTSSLQPLFPVASPAWIHPDGRLMINASPRVYELSGVATNDLRLIGNLGQNDLTVGLSSVAFAPELHAMFAGRRALSSQLFYFNTESLALNATYAVPMIEDVFVFHGELWAIFQTAPNTMVLRKLENPATGADTNAPPIASFTTFPASPTAITPVFFDSGGSTDESPPTLRRRWDFNGDGLFETEFNTNSSVAHLFSRSGLYKSVLELKDHFGEISRVTNSVLIQPQEDQGQTFTNHLPFLLPFAATRALMDERHQRLCIIDSLGKRLLLVDINTGLTTRQFNFSFTPDAITLSPDQKWLYVALLPRPHNSFSDQGSGFVAEFDLDRAVKTQEFATSIDPGTLAATDQRIVLVCGGSGQLTELQSYDALSGELRGRADSLRELSPLLFLPGQNLVLAALPFAGNSQFLRFGVGADGSLSKFPLFRNLDSWGEGPLTLSPSGRFVASALGTVVSLALSGEPLDPVRHLPPPELNRNPTGASSSVVFETDSRNMIIVATGNELDAFNLDTFELAGSLVLTNSPFFIGKIENEIVTLSLAGSNTAIQSVLSPVVGSEGNKPPLVQLTRNPSAPITESLVLFDASGSSDESGSLETLDFRWDLDGDGQFDTTWSKTNQITSRFLTAGDYNITVAVRDHWGAISTQNDHFSVTLESGSGEAAPPHTPWALPFAPADFEFDSARARLWLTDTQSLSVIRVSLTNGIADRVWRYPYTTESLAISPDGKYLYASLSIKPHELHWQNQLGYVAEFDLDLGVQTRVLKLNIDPGDLAVTDSYLVVAGASAGNSAIGGALLASYSRTNGAQVSAVPINPGEFIVLSHSQDHIFAAPKDLRFWDFTRFRFDPRAGTIGAATIATQFITNTLGVGDRVYPLPGDRNVLSAFGEIFRNDPVDPNDLRVVEKPLKSVTAFAEVPHTNLFVAVSGSVINYFANDTRQALGSFPLGLNISGAGFVDSTLVLLSVTNNSTHILTWNGPTATPENNSVPTIHWTAPTNGQVFEYPPFGMQVNLQTIPFDVDGGIASVHFFENGKLLEIVTNYPFNLTAALLPGDHHIDTVAVDNLGATSAVQTVNFRLTTPPTFTWVNPRPARIGQRAEVIDRGSDVTLEINPEDRDGSVATGEFYRSSFDPTNLLVRLTAPPWRSVVSNITEKAYFAARVIDNDGVASALTGSSLIDIAGPPGDEFYRPFSIQGTNAHATASNLTATGQYFENVVINSGAPHSLWWTWTAPTNGEFRVSTRGSSFDTDLGVFSGDDIGFLNTVGRNDDDPNDPPASSVKFGAFQGQLYHIGVDGYLGATGTVQLTLEWIGPLAFGATPNRPANDKFTNRVVLSGVNVAATGSNSGATSEAFEPRHGLSSPGPSVWWEWKAATDGLLQLNTTGSSFDTVLAVYTGPTDLTNLVQLTRVGFSDDNLFGDIESALEIHVTNNTTLFFAVTGFTGTTGNITLNLELGLESDNPPVNDNFAAPEIISGTGITIKASNALATAEPFEPTFETPSLKHSLWYKWRAPISGTVYLMAQGPVSTDSITVFRVDSVDSVSGVSLRTPQKPGAVSFQADADTEYLIKIDSSAPNAGSLLFTLRIPELNAIQIVLEDIRLQPDGTVEIAPTGLVAGTVVVLASDNLSSWRPIKTNQVSPKILLPPTSDPRMYFRLLNNR
jgi:sugar lactone lactonase YvrE